MPVQSTKVMQYTFISKQFSPKDAFALIVEGITLVKDIQQIVLKYLERHYDHARKCHQ